MAMALGSQLREMFSLRRNSRPPLEAYYVYLLALLVGYWISDLSLTAVRPMMLPTKPPPARPSRMRNEKVLLRSDYNAIVDRNIFSLDGVIPPPLSQEGAGRNEDAPAVLSQLPLALQGTIVHANPKKSVATVLLKSKNLTKAFRIDEEIEGMARVTKIERGKLTFRNLTNSRLEYIEVVSESKITFGMNPAASEEVEARGDFDFSLKRDDINKYTSDLSGILNQARMIPNVVPGTGGRVEGFRFVNIQPNSIYEKLGFKPDDIIKGVNGEPVNSPTKAMELYQTLKSENKITLTVERNGKEETFQYTVTK